MKKILIVIVSLACAAFCHAQEIYHVQTSMIKASIPQTLWGLFFEDINRGADGGVYAELVKNRSFDFPKPMTGWKSWPTQHLRDGIFTITDDMGANAKNPKFLAVSTQTGDIVGLMNAGYDGMAFKKGLPYTFTLRYKQVQTGVHVKVSLFNSSKVIAQESIQLNASSNDWQEQQLTITPNDTARNGGVLVMFEGEGKLDVDRISLFPTDTWKHQPGGLRNDLVQKLADLKPGFLRFPGGCIVEGNQLVHRYQWKNTVGPLEDRLLVQSIWADDVPARQTPDYMETFGLGFLEYFELCEDIGAAPLPIINCGMSCQFDAAEVVPLSQLKPFIQDALDLIEFANGDTATVWGKKRKQYGHPAPFNMQLLGVGNENWGPQYAERLALFTEAIKAKYPYVKIVGATGYSRNEPVFKYMDSVLRVRHADIIDEHFYSTPEWFYQNSNRYDSYDRKGPKIFVGEYAAQSDHIGSMDNKNNLKSALSEAAFMTGIERNADVVSMASYAPLFAHVTGWQWTPNLIWFDNSSSYNTPNYYVQQMFSLNKGTDVVPVTLDGKSIQGQDSIWASAVIDKNTHELIIKIVNANPSPRQKTIVLDDQKNGGGVITTLSGGLDQMNSLEKPGMIKPVAEPIAVTKGKLEVTLQPYSMNVIRISMQ